MTTLVTQSLPVAYLLVRDIAPNENSREKMRTKLGAGYINNQTKHIVTQDDVWRIGCIVGPFQTIEIARTFVKWWSGETLTTKRKTKAARGPIMRMSRGVALAFTFGIDRWIDPNALSRSQSKFYNIIVSEESLIVREREDVAVATVNE